MFLKGRCSGYSNTSYGLVNTVAVRFLTTTDFSHITSPLPDGKLSLNSSFFFNFLKYNGVIKMVSVLVQVTLEMISTFSVLLTQFTAFAPLVVIPLPGLLSSCNLVSSILKNFLCWLIKLFLVKISLYRLHSFLPRPWTQGLDIS